MKDRNKVIIGLLVVVAAIFLIWPDLLGSGGGTTLGVVPSDTQTQEVVSDISCQVVQDCVDFAVSQGGPADVNVKCESNVCVWITVDIPIAEVSE